MSTEAHGKVTPPGLTQPPSQNPTKVEKDTNPVPASIRGHKSVPAHPEAANGINPHNKFDAGTKPKTMDECVADYNKKHPKKTEDKPAPVTPPPAK